jgi:hypothetical protein
MGKKIRFGDLVRASGRPEIVTLWTKPTQNRSFIKAVKANRVLTVFQGRGQRRDSGQIGFHERANALYLVFPRPLSNSRQDQVIAINYQLIEQPGSKATPSNRSKAERDKTLTLPLEKEFSVTVRRTARMTSELRLTAPDENMARQKALEIIKKEPFVPATEEDEIVAVA